MYSKDGKYQPSVFRRARLRDQVELRAIPDGLPVTIRRAYPDDGVALARLADLDDGLVPRGSVLVAEVGGELWAAASLDGRGAVADPFRPSAGLLRALRSRARRTADDGRRLGGRRRRER
ncbi:MAG: hypothetical protein QOF77_816 [Solirubrobacteraceae bacterium]|nr:hypothetical protein [Solirubrobacteraceae bacterium]